MAKYDEVTNRVMIQLGEEESRKKELEKEEKTKKEEKEAKLAEKKNAKKEKKAKKFSEKFGLHFAESSKEMNTKMCKLEEDVTKMMEMSEKILNKSKE